jgi:hypothetical protein
MFLYTPLSLRSQNILVKGRKHPVVCQQIPQRCSGTPHSLTTGEQYGYLMAMVSEPQGLLGILSGIFKNRMQAWWKMRVRTWRIGSRQLLGVLGIKKKPQPTSAPAAA